MDICSLIVGVKFDRHNQTIDHEKLHDDILPSIRHLLATEFGGYTEVITTGGWINPDGHLVEEEGRQFTILVDVSMPQYRKQINIFQFRCECIGRMLNQHSIVRIIKGVALIKEVPYPA